MSAREKCKKCNGSGMVQIALGVRGLKKCDYCNGTKIDKSAREMFEELGYELTNDKKDIVYEIRDKEKCNQLVSQIKFSINQHGDKEIWGAVLLTSKRLKAIQKQIEELGWE